MNKRRLVLMRSFIVFISIVTTISCGEAGYPSYDSISDDVIDDDNFPFRRTACSYDSQTQNIDVIINIVFGPEFRIADWNDVKDWINQHSVKEFIQNLKWEPGLNNSLMITNNNEYYWNKTLERYLITFFDQYIPDYYAVHDEIEAENYYIVLGSWYRLDSIILVIKKK